MIGEDVLYLSVRELGDRIRTRQLSPVELTEAYLERCKKYGPQLNAYATLTPDLALQQARQAEAEINQGHYRGPLHGIPYAAKDLLAVKGYPTTWGAKPYQNQRFDYNATVIDKLNDAGAVLLGKAAMIELAGGLGYRFAAASATGAAKNPWNTNCWTCGSSSGSGAIVASALAAFAIGTETWGSIVCPSAFCGVSGLRPTFGRVGRGGAMALSYSMDKIGPMCRTADDCSLVLAPISGHDPTDAGSLPESQARFIYNPPKTPLRMARIEKAWEKPDPEIAAAFEQAFAVLQKAGQSISSVQLPEGPFEAAGGIVINVEAASAFSKLIDSGEVAQLSDPLSRIGGYVAQTVDSSGLHSRAAYSPRPAAEDGRHLPAMRCAGCALAARIRPPRSTPTSRPVCRSPILSAASAISAACRRSAFLADSPAADCRSAFSFLRRC